MDSLRKPGVELNPYSLTDPHAFESIGSILHRLFERKADLEAHMMPQLDRSRSLELDAVLEKLDAMEGASAC